MDLTAGPQNDGVARVQAVAGYMTHLPTLDITPVELSGQGATLRINLPTAADGTNLDACRDGQCAVRLDAPGVIPLDAPGLKGGVSVTPVDGAILVRADTPREFQVSVSCGGASPGTTCPSDASPGMLTSTLVLGGALYFPTSTLILSASDRGGAVVTIKPPS